MPSLLSSLQVEKVDDNTYLSTTLWRPYGARGVFGGHVIALALVSSGRTVEPGMGLHSQHCYFILPADPDVRIEFKVDRLRDGRSYTTRIVRASQDGRAIFVLAASYARPPKGSVGGNLPFGFIPSQHGIGKGDAQSGIRPAESSVSHGYRFASDLKKDKDGDSHDEVGGEGQVIDRGGSSGIPPFTPRWHIPLPDGVSSYEESIEEEVRWRQFLAAKGNGMKGKGRKYIEEYIQERTESPVSIAVARRDPGQPRNVRMIWLRARLQPGEKATHEDIKSMIGYMTDFQFIGTAARSIGLTSASSPRIGMLATLDHTTHFYPFPNVLDASRPLLHVMEAAITDAPSGRGIVRGLVYTEEGVLIAVTSQEGVVRANMGSRERGVTEGGGFEDKAKL